MLHSFPLFSHAFPFMACHFAFISLYVSFMLHSCPLMILLCCIHFPQGSCCVHFLSFRIHFLSWSFMLPSFCFHFSSLCIKHTGRKVICSNRSGGYPPECSRLFHILLSCDFYRSAIVFEACAACHLQGWWTYTCTWAGNALVVLRGKRSENEMPRDYSMGLSISGGSP